MPFSRNCMNFMAVKVKNVHVKLLAYIWARLMHTFLHFNVLEALTTLVRKEKRFYSMLFSEKEMGL